MIFLLGGHDLEMLEIKKLLEREGKQYFDADLRWDNADLQAYHDIIVQNLEEHFVGVELRDANGIAPEHYTLVDHHNEYSSRPASILQVAELLGVEPDERMLQVAANDSGYIPAMKALGASDETIAAIRREDRLAQGVTEEDESLAERSIKKHLSRVGNMLIVYALTSRFSAICDRLFPYRSLLIYNDEEWVFYGEGKSAIACRMDEHIATKRVYQGGGDNGYIGSVKKAFSPQEIKHFVSSLTQ